MALIADILFFLLDIYLWIIIIYVIISWLIAFGVFDAQNPKARQLVDLFEKLTDPVLKPLQKAIPPIAGIDLSPIIAIIAIHILKRVIAYLVYG